MLERKQASDGVVFYQSPLLRERGAPHGFSTRLGGVSGAPFDSLNLGNPNGAALQDDLGNIAENYRRLAEATGCAGRQLRRVHQVHGRRVVEACCGAEPGNDPQADALFTGDRACIVSVRTADCVPVLLASDDGRVVAAVHAGWRGVIGGVVPAAIEAIGTQSVAVAIGPSIGPDAFEVGSEVVEEFHKAFGERALLRIIAGGKGLVDLQAAIVLQLEGMGFSRKRIDTTDRCTFRDGAEFFSHRRDKGVTGRMAAIISPG